MADNNLIVQDPTSTSYPPGSKPVQAGGRAAEGLVAELHGKYYTQTYNGQMFMGTTTTASAIPINSSTAPTFVLWNPAGSGVNLVLARYSAGWVATTEAPGNIQFAYLGGAGTGIATAAPISAFTAGTIVNGNLSVGNTALAKFGTAATLTTAGTVFATSGQSHLTTTGTATFGSFSIVYDFDGLVIVPPNTAFYTVASAATASTYNQSVHWYEAPA